MTRDKDHGAWGRIFNARNWPGFTEKYGPDVAQDALDFINTVMKDQ